jgi:hypothetical protein
MNRKIRVIKQTNQRQSGPEISRPSDLQRTREITVTVKQWVTEFKQKQRAQVLRTN